MLGRASPFASSASGTATPPRAHLSSFGRFTFYERGSPTRFGATNSEDPNAHQSRGSRDPAARSYPSNCQDASSPTRGGSSRNGARQSGDNDFGSLPHTPRRQMTRSSSVPLGVSRGDEEVHAQGAPQTLQGRRTPHRRRGHPTPPPKKERYAGGDEAAMMFATPFAGSVFAQDCPAMPSEVGQHVELAWSRLQRRAAPTPPPPAKAYATSGNSHTRASSSRGQQTSTYSNPTGPATARSPAMPSTRASTQAEGDLQFERSTSKPEDQPLVLHEADTERHQLTGLGAIQPEGRAQVLQQWDCPDKACAASKRNSKQQLERGKSLDQKSFAQPGFMEMVESAWTSPTTAPAIEVHIPCEGEGGPKLEWSTLSRKSRQAIKQWLSREIGGRHCLMVLEHENAIDFLISPLDSDEVFMSDLRGGAMLNALSGLKAETQGGDGGWLYSAVFAKTPSMVLDEAIAAARADMGSGPSSRSASSFGLPLEQMNLALRRIAMNAQSAGMRDLVVNPLSKKSEGPRSSEEYLQVQIWLELLRLHSQGVSFSGGCSARASTAQPGLGVTQEGSTSESLSLALRPGQGKSKRDSSLTPAVAGTACSGDDASQKPSKGTITGRSTVSQFQWDDRSVLSELGKPESELEEESKKLDLDILKSQNRSLEAYLMRLVRQRDELRRITKLADECDSYFILGLGGPDVTEDEVKRAYRTLARKEHPDKAGVGNKERFQQIQQAYAAVLRQRRNSDNSDSGASSNASVSTRASSSASAVTEAAGGDGAVGMAAKEAAERADQAREAADQAAAAAHLSYHICKHGTSLQRAQKRCVVQALCDLTRQGTEQLRVSAKFLRSVREYVCIVSKSAKAALGEYGDWVDTAIAGAGLRERAEIAGGAGKSSMATAELLVKICEANEAAIQKAEKIAVPSTSSSDSGSGERLLGKSLARTASVARCAADEAIGAATTALELSCSLVALDREWKREKGREAEQRRSGAQPASDDTTTASGCDSGSADREKKDGSLGKKEGADNADKDDKDSTKKEKKDDKESNEPASPEERARREHVSLRVRNLRCLGGLNDEVLQLQNQLRCLLNRNQGALLPAVSLEEKGGVFELVGQILHSGLIEISIHLSDALLSHRQVLERSFAFVLALEHSREVALAAEVRTQVLKLAALVDLELLCQIIDGPFQRRLLSLSRRQAQQSGNGAALQSPLRGDSFRRSTSLRSPKGGSHVSTGCAPMSARDAENWDKAVHSFCSSITKCLQERGKSQAKPVHVPSPSP